MKKLFNGTQEERNARRAQEENAIMNNTQQTNPLISSEGVFTEIESAHATAEYKQRDDGCYEYITKWNYNDGVGSLRKWTFSPTHQLIEQVNYTCEDGLEHQTQKTTYTKNGRTDDKVTEVTYYQTWDDDDTGETQTDYDVIDAESVTKSHSYQMTPFTRRTEEMSYMKPECPDDEINVLNSELSITDVRYGYTDGQVVEGIKPYGKKADGPSNKNLIGVIRVENKKACISGTTKIDVNLKTPSISFKSTENHGSSVDPSHRHEHHYYSVMNKLFNKPAYEVRRTTSSELPDAVTITTHDYSYRDTVYGKALIDREKRFSDISNQLVNLPAVKGFKTHDCYPTTTRQENNNPDLAVRIIHNMHLFEDLNNIEKDAARPNDYFHVTIEGGVYDGSTFHFNISTGPSDTEAGKYLWCSRIELKVKDGDSTAFYRYCRDRKDAMTNKKVITIDKYTDFNEAIVSIINTTPDEIPDGKIFYDIKTAENGDKVITHQSFYRNYYDSADNANS